VNHGQPQVSRAASAEPGEHGPVVGLDGWFRSRIAAGSTNMSANLGMPVTIRVSRRGARTRPAPGRFADPACFPHAAAPGCQALWRDVPAQPGSRLLRGRLDNDASTAVGERPGQTQQRRLNSRYLDTYLAPI